jgi:drug/metabolite transporter (DMT)-like permease
MIYTLATISALMFALASALQHKSAQGADHTKALKPTLVFTLATKPVWLIGIVADIGGLLFQFAALAEGSVLVVQPILAVGLVFSLVFSAALYGKWLSGSEIVLSLITTAGLFGFLRVGIPVKLIDRSSLSSWLIVVAITALLVFGLGTMALRSLQRKRTVLLSVGAGILHGVSVSLSKVVSQDFVSLGPAHLLLDPHVYLLIIVGAADLVVIQSAFQSGPLKDSLPIISVIEPIVALLISVIVLHEHPSASGLELVVAGLSLTVMLAGVWGLARVTTEHIDL